MTVLCYHTVDPDWRSPLAVTPERFEEQCRWLARHRTVVDLPTALRLMDRRGRLPRGTVALTFDDGFTGVRDHALPILRRFGLPATVFVVADTLLPGRGPVDWVDTPPAWELETLAAEELEELERSGVQVASHSLSHLTLTELDPTACEEDLRDSRRVLEELLHRPVPYLAYPRGRHDGRVRSAAERAGYTHAFALPEQHETVGAFAVPRIGVHGHNSTRTVAVKATPGYQRVRTSRSWAMARTAREPLRRRRHREYRTRPDAPPDLDPASTRTSEVAYIVSRFPKISETFVLYELLAVEELGVRVRFHPLLRERVSVMHPEAADLLPRVHFLPFLSPEILGSLLWFLRHRPRALLDAVSAVLRGTWGSRNFLVGALGIIPKVVHIARSLEADGVGHVHCHFANHPAVAGFLIHRLTGIPFSFTAHGSDLHVDRHMLPEKVAEAAFVVTVSDSNRDLIVADCGPASADKVHVIHCGVDTSVFRPSARGRGATLEVLCIGTLHEVKGQRHAIDACRRLVDRGLPVHLTLLGDGPDRRALERRIAELDLQAHVRITGALPRQAVVEALGTADVLVAPSVPTRQGKREGIPVVVMEAMSAGLPVVASRLSGIPELVGDGASGFLVPPGDADAIADALERLHLDPDLATKLGSAGRATVIDRFDLRRNAARLTSLFPSRPEAGPGVHAPTGARPTAPWAAVEEAAS